MANEVERVEPGDPRYDLILIRHRRDGGDVWYSGKWWRGFEDGDHTVFIRVNPHGMDSHYEDLTLKNG